MQKRKAEGLRGAAKTSRANHPHCVGYDESNMGVKCRTHPGAQFERVARNSLVFIIFLRGDHSRQPRAEFSPVSGHVYCFVDATCFYPTVTQSSSEAQQELVMQLVCPDMPFCHPSCALTSQ